MCCFFSIHVPHIRREIFLYAVLHWMENWKRTWIYITVILSGLTMVLLKYLLKIQTHCIFLGRVMVRVDFLFRMIEHCMRFEWRGASCSFSLCVYLFSCVFVSSKVREDGSIIYTFIGHILKLINHSLCYLILQTFRSIQKLISLYFSNSNCCALYIYNVLAS